MSNENMEFYPYMQNREMSWLKFNERVLFEANRIETPVLERLRYISIFTSNLDEFFMVRVGTLTDYAQFDKTYFDNKTGMTAQEQLSEIFKAVLPLYKQREKAYNSVMAELRQSGVSIADMEEMSPDEIKSLKKQFSHSILPLLSPQIIDSRHPFPHLVNKQLHIAVMLEKKSNVLFGIIAIPADMDRLVQIENGMRCVLLEDLILYFSDEVFSIYKVLEKNIIAVTRNADIDTEDEFLDENIDYRAHMKNILKKRQRLSPVRLELVTDASKGMLKYLTDKLSLRSEQVFYTYAPIDLTFCSLLDKLADEDLRKRLLWSAYIPTKSVFSQQKGKMLSYFSSGNDMLFTYPYESISAFIDLIKEAASDLSVTSIKITLYRIDMHSRLAESLIQAVENGKEVVILMELRARFDERNNIEWASRLEESGCRVIFGLLGYKVHSKVCLITRRVEGNIEFISLIGTGNFNEKTSKQYTDISVLTSDQGIGHDASNFFSNLLLNHLEGDYEHLWVAPNSFKGNILSCIEQERQKAALGQSARIIIKCNSLTDRDIIEKLSQASCDGVRIQMIIRGICCIVPQMQGFTENISVISIVGKFLEHSRVFVFGADEDAKIFISSADLMTRNTERRIEVACPIYDAELKSRISEMLEIQLRDNTHAWEQQADRSYVLRKPLVREQVFNSQELLSVQCQILASRNISLPKAQEDEESKMGEAKQKTKLRSRIEKLINFRRIFRK